MSEFQPSMWKPRAKAVVTIDQLPIGDRELIVSLKADGEFTCVYYERGKPIMAINLWGTIRGESFPWPKELREALDRQPINSCILLAETYGCEVDPSSPTAIRMLKLPETMHHLKGGDQAKIHLGLFDLAAVNGKTANQSYIWRLQELESWVQGCLQVGVLPYIQPRSREEIRAFWDWWVERLGWEGLFARDDQQNLYKVKKHLTIDAVIIGLNKRGRWQYGEVTCFKIALMDNHFSFIEVGDVASGIDHDLRKALYTLLMQHRTAEHDTWVEIKPFVIVEVEATETFRQVKPRYVLEGGHLNYKDTVEAHSLRHPRFIRFRSDKQACVDDVGYERQLPS